MGSGRKCLPDAVAGWNGVSAFGHGPGKEGHAEGLEHGADHHDLYHVYLRHLPHTQRRCLFGPCIRPIPDRRLFRGLHRYCAVRGVVSTDRPVAVSEEREPNGVARIA